MKATSLPTLFILAATASVCIGFANGGAVPSGVVNVADFVASDGKPDAADGIQRLIDANPNRTLWFEDGPYLLPHPICTPAHPKRSVYSGRETKVFRDLIVDGRFVNETGKASSICGEYA